LNDKDRSSQKEIGKFLGENKVMIKRIIDNLEKGKYLKRKQSKYDRRFNKIELTKKGKNLYSELKPFAEETLKEAYSGLEDKEIANCLDTLNKIANKLDNL
jgi:MarR family 2-MHQ and catechol resistance regulon transcriptional repressor